jgi:hypothetical protein
MPHRVPPLRNADIDALFCAATNVAISDHAELDAPARRTLGADALPKLHELLLLQESDHPVLCRCHGELSFHFYQGAKHMVELRLHHGVHIETDVGQGRTGAALLRPTPLLRWLAKQGIPDPLHGFEATQNSAKRFEQGREAWAAARPAGLPVETEDPIRWINVPPDDAERALEASYPDPEERTLALLAWFGASGLGWNGVPGFELQTAALAERLSGETVVRVLQRDALDEATLRGGARFLEQCARTNRDGLVGVPAELWGRLRGAVVRGCEPECVRQFDLVPALAAEQRAVRENPSPRRLGTGVTVIGVGRSFSLSGLRRAGGRLFANDHREVVRFEAGSTTPTVVRDRLGLVSHFDADEHGVVVAERVEGTVLRVPLQGGPPVVLATGARDPEFVAAAAGVACWLEDRRRVVRIRRSDGEVSTIAARGEISACPKLTREHAFWLEHRANGQIVLVRNTLSGRSPTDVALVRRRAGRYDGRWWHFAVTETEDAYWCDPDQASVMLLQRGHRAPRVVQRLKHLPHALAADVSGACVVDGPHGGEHPCDVLWLPADGAPARVLCQLRYKWAAAVSLLVDSSCVYWCEENTIRSVQP